MVIIACFCMKNAAKSQIVTIFWKYFCHMECCFEKKLYFCKKLGNYAFDRIERETAERVA